MTPPTITTPEGRRELARLYDAGSSGEWTLDPDWHGSIISSALVCPVTDARECDVPLIVAMHANLPAAIRLAEERDALAETMARLIAERDELRAEVARLLSLGEKIADGIADHVRQARSDDLTRLRAIEAAARAWDASDVADAWATSRDGSPISALARGLRAALDAKEAR